MEMKTAKLKVKGLEIGDKFRSADGRWYELTSKDAAHAMVRMLGTEHSVEFPLTTEVRELSVLSKKIW